MQFSVPKFQGLYMYWSCNNRGRLFPGVPSDCSNLNFTWNLWLLHVIQMVNSFPPRATYMHQWSGSALVQLMACCLYGAKPLPEPMLAYCQSDSWQQISVKLELEFCYFHSRKCIWNCRLPQWWPFCPEGDEFSGVIMTHSVVKLMTLVGILYSNGPI